jgi:hypothetical protein
LFHLLFHKIEKPLKHQILSKTRNRLKDYKDVAYFRAKENLNHIMHAKKVLGKRLLILLIE